MKRLIILGAGASVDSGLKTYRGIDGLYSSSHIKMPEHEDLFDETKRLQIFRTIQMICVDSAVAKASGTLGHTYAKLKDYVADSLVVTQNIDGLAPLAFLTESKSKVQRIIEFHGNAYKCRCMGCGRPCPTPEPMFDSTRPVELGDLSCKSCGGRLRPCVVLCGERYSEESMSAVYTFIGHQRPQQVFIAGTSLTFPIFRDFADKAKKLGATVIHVNPDPAYGTSVRRNEIWVKTIDELPPP